MNVVKGVKCQADGKKKRGKGNIKKPRKPVCKEGL